MKRINTFKKLLFVSLLGTAGAVNGQVHPYAFGIVGSATATNWYANYVGLRFQVTAPSSVAGDYINSPAVVGTAAGDWPSIVYSPIINVPVIMPPVADSAGTSSFTPGSMTGKICLLWRGPISAPATFSQKAQYAQDAGAVACIIINEYSGGLPFAPGYTAGFTVHIPVIMIGNYDGIALENAYNAAPGSLKMTITPWGQGNNKDLGFVPGGEAAWHSYAIPYDQVFSSGNPAAYKGVTAAFVANYGNEDMTNVKVSSSLSFTPKGGASAVIHSDATPILPLFKGLAHTPVDPTNDSIWAFFANSEYDVTPTGTAGPGEFDLTYTISSDSLEDYAGDNTSVTKFFATDSLYSKGEYDFVNNVPVCGLYEAPQLAGGGNTDFLWGPMFFVAKGGAQISTVQFSIAASAAGPIGLEQMNVFVFKWVDNLGGVADSIVENGELTLVSSGVKVFDPVNDTSQGMFFARMLDSAGDAGSQALLQSNTWYFVTPEVPAGFFLGIDGHLNPDPRVYGRAHVAGLYDYSGILWTGDAVSPTNPITTSTPTTQELPLPFTGSGVVDSFNYNNVKGMIPAATMIVNKTPPVIDHSGVKNVLKPAITTAISPNPASDYLNVSVDFAQPTSTVTYTIIDGLARVVSKNVHNTSSSMNDKYTINTASLASGSYYLVINTPGNINTKKFVVVR